MAIVITISRIRNKRGEEDVEQIEIVKHGSSRSLLASSDKVINYGWFFFGNLSIICGMACSNLCSAFWWMPWSCLPLWEITRKVWVFFWFAKVHYHQSQGEWGKCNCKAELLSPRLIKFVSYHSPHNTTPDAGNVWNVLHLGEECSNVMWCVVEIFYHFLLGMWKSTLPSSALYLCFWDESWERCLVLFSNQFDQRTTLGFILIFSKEFA